ncbi:MAG: hypothetical protein AAF215_09625 [Cyanobacteria bacterium P01_A01_bin.123]
MVAFRGFLIAVVTFIFSYTAIVISNHGFGLLEVFFGDIATMGWPGQFDLDFLFVLILSAFWLIWRHHFSPLGIFFGLLAFVGGSMFLASYLLLISIRVKGDISELLLGETRANG